MSQAEENPHELEIQQALAEYMQMCDSGALPDREMFLSSHPELREQLADLLNAADWIEQLAGPKIADIAASGFESGHNVDETLPHLKIDVSSATENTLPSQPFGGNLRSSDSEPVKKKTSRELTQPILPCKFGDYVLERVLGRGGMGVVYAGRQVHLDRPVAIKMIRSGALASEEEVQRFYAEARSAAKLDHPNIVTVYQCGEYEEHRFFSMDYVPGLDLSRMIENGPLEAKRAARYVRDVAKAIQYAHDRGILHRDLKPANVLVDEHDNVRITDFGLAKFIGNETGLTAEGAALGTPSYMSPEQAAGKVDEHHHATDIYSLGAILFTILTGKPPFKASTVVQTIMHVIHRPAPKVRSLRPEIDSDLETIVDVCLQKAPERRYASAGDLANDLTRYINGVPIQARPVSKIRRAWHWLLGVPIFGAVLDHRVVEPTDAHRWVQRGLISVALMMIAAWVSILIPSAFFRNRMPKTVRIASGTVGGAYDELSHQIVQVLIDKANCDASAISTMGANENIEKLDSGEVDLALMQADTIGSSSIVVVAPLFYEAVHILVRNDLSINTLEDLRGHKVRVGPDKAGSHSVAQLLLGSAGLTFDDIEIDTKNWQELSQQPEADAAIVVSKLGAASITQILCAGSYTLLGMPNAIQFALDEPSFHTLLVDNEDYPDCGLPATGIATVTTTAFLVTKPDTPSVLIQTVLQHLFEPEMVQAAGILTAERAAHWQGLPFHPAAREFFQTYRGSKPIAVLD